jgi:membrane protease YdiL (CAAX protease family)
MDIIQLIVMKLVLPLGIVALMHFKLSAYPQALPIEANTRRGILETLIMWAISVAVLTAIVFSDFAAKMDAPSAGTLLQFVLITAVPYVLIPVVYLGLVKNWTLEDYGFRKPLPGSRAIIIFSVLLFALSGALPLMNSGFSPAPVMMLVFALWQPAFIEEFFFRGVIQSRLERVIGQNKAWIYGGILFGLAHFVFNFYIRDMDLVTGLLQLAGQITSGWMFGILFMKTRSLLPGILAHYLTNGVLASLIATIF